MALTKLTDNVSNVSSLDDKPSLSSTELKRVFDRGNESIKEYINTILIPELEERTYELINDLTSGGTTKVLSDEMGKKLNNEKQKVIRYGTTVPTLAEGEIFIQIFD